MLPFILAVVGVYLLFLILVARVATRPPRAPVFLSPQALGYPVEEVEFSSRGGVVRGWWLPVSNAKRVAILMHGYAMCRAENAVLAVALAKHGISSLLFDFRGTGRSDSMSLTIGPGESEDALAACDWVSEREPAAPRILIGSSMGAVAAALAMSKRDDAADVLVLDSAFASLPSATLGWWRWLGGWPALILLSPVVLIAGLFSQSNPFRVRTDRALSAISKPTLILHGARDRMVALEHAERTYAASAGDPKKMVVFPKSGHSEARWSESEAFTETILEFLDEVVPAGDQRS